MEVSTRDLSFTFHGREEGALGRDGGGDGEHGVYAAHQHAEEHEFADARTEERGGRGGDRVDGEGRGGGGGGGEVGG